MRARLKHLICFFWLYLMMMTPKDEFRSGIFYQITHTHNTKLLRKKNATFICHGILPNTNTTHITHVSLCIFFINDTMMNILTQTKPIQV